MTTARGLPGIAVASGGESVAKVRIAMGLHTFRTVVRGFPTLLLLILAVTVICALLAPVLAHHSGAIRYGTCYYNADGAGVFISSRQSQLDAAVQEIGGSAT
jgi:hypothetical protein